MLGSIASVDPQDVINEAQFAGWEKSLHSDERTALKGNSARQQIHGAILIICHNARPAYLKLIEMM